MRFDRIQYDPSGLFVLYFHCPDSLANQRSTSCIISRHHLALSICPTGPLLLIRSVTSHLLFLPILLPTLSSASHSTPLKMAGNAMSGGNFTHNNTVAPEYTDRVLPLFSLKGRTAIVSGAGAGIGKSVAQALAEAGANVAIWYNSNKKALEEAEKIEKDFGVKCTSPLFVTVKNRQLGIVPELWACRRLMGSPSISQTFPIGAHVLIPWERHRQSIPSKRNLFRGRRSGCQPNRVGIQRKTGYFHSE
jgi:hypothetical protein